MMLAAPVQPPAALELFVRTYVGDSEFTALVEQAVEPTGHRLRISCRSGCAKPVAYVQDEGDAPLSLFRRWDGGTLLYSLWATGSAYHVKVFTLQPEGVRMVLDAYSLSRPDFTSLPGGVEAVRTTERQTERSARDDQRTITYAWSGGRFGRR